MEILYILTIINNAKVKNLMYRANIACNRDCDIGNYDRKLITKLQNYSVIVNDKNSTKPSVTQSNSLSDTYILKMKNHTYINNIFINNC
jgi:hypothetical protein